MFTNRIVCAKCTHFAVLQKKKIQCSNLMPATNTHTHTQSQKRWEKNRITWHNKIMIQKGFSTSCQSDRFAVNSCTSKTLFCFHFAETQTAHSTMHMHSIQFNFSTSISTIFLTIFLESWLKFNIINCIMLHSFLEKQDGIAWYGSFGSWKIFNFLATKKNYFKSCSCVNGFI